MSDSISNVQGQQDNPNDYNVVTDFESLGYNPVHADEQFTYFELRLPGTQGASVRINNKTNQFRVVMVQREGVLEVKSLLFHPKPEEILEAIIPLFWDQILSGDVGKFKRRS